MAKVLSVAPYNYLPPKDGGQWCIYWGNQTLLIKNEVSCWSVKTNKPNTEVKFEQINTMSNGIIRYFPLYDLLYLVRLLKRHKYQYIFCNHHYLVPTLWLASKFTGVRLYIRSHNIEYIRFKSIGKLWWPLMYLFEMWAYRVSNHVFFISEDDKTIALSKFKLNRNKVSVLPFPAPFNQQPLNKETKNSQGQLLDIDANCKWFVFTGAMNYTPNRQAVENLLNEVYPIIINTQIPFKLLICGRGLTPELILKCSNLENVHYLGFVDDLHGLLSVCDVFVNPVLVGGGVKTKVIEALSLGLPVISTRSGAIGIEPEVCGENLMITDDGKWKTFVDGLLKMSNSKKEAPVTFFEHYGIKHVSMRIQKFFS